jgi:hypothetical protein
VASAGGTDDWGSEQEEKEAERQEEEGLVEGVGEAKVLARLFISIDL